MEQAVIEKVKSRLSEIEKEHDVKILHAVESGSRAWGFDSTDSDYDIRFIYAHKKNWYLNILPKRDVIEYPIINDFDYSGWDLRKTLFLTNKSNPVLFEWLKSPIVYCKDECFYDIMIRLTREYFSPIASVHHYLHMAGGNFRQYLRPGEVRIKKYFYVLRPLLACMWIEKYNETPPLEFEKLITQIADGVLLEKINELLAKKRSGIELGFEPKIEVISDFVEAQLKHFEKVAVKFEPGKRTGQELLEEGFLKILDLHNEPW